MQRGEHPDPNRDASLMTAGQVEPQHPVAEIACARG